jgi:hypothetical protein
LSYEDYLKHYILNVEFVINNKVIHPFYRIIDVLNNNEFSADEILERIPLLDPSKNNVIINIFDRILFED